jgi:tRNA U54 and U55 pseudouridine synthase Pus10
MLSNTVNVSIASVFSLPGQDRAVYVYPNPISSSRTLNVQLKDVLAGQSVLFIYDNTGRRVKSINAKLNTTADMLVIDISDLAAGHYTLSFTDKLGELTKSFVVE